MIAVSDFSTSLTKEAVLKNTPKTPSAFSKRPSWTVPLSVPVCSDSRRNK